MRIRPLAALSVAALSTLLLAGCSGSGDPQTTPTGAADADLCAAAAPSGTASEAVEIAGEAGEASTATFAFPLEVTTLERTVAVEGDGEAIAPGDYVDYALSAFSGETGELLGELGYNEGEILPAGITADTPLGQILGCATIGTRLIATFPAVDENSSSEVYIVDVLGTTPTAAWGEEQEPVAGLPTVELAGDGQPSVTIPDAAAPAEIQIEVLKKGDGPAVEIGDTTLLQYYGVDWETGESFDSSWKNGAPYSNPGNQYVPGFVQALEGQTVGSQVVVVIPPALGYGEAGSSEHELAGKTLVFVVDILATQHPAVQ